MIDKYFIYERPNCPIWFQIGITKDIGFTLFYIGIWEVFQVYASEITVKLFGVRIGYFVFDIGFFIKRKESLGNGNN